MPQKLPLSEFKQIVRLAPLVSIDFVVWSKSGKLLLGRRNNEPAKGQLFVPGGRIYKGETMAEAFARLAEEELGLKRQITGSHPLGVYEHMYPNNTFGIQGFGTHYVVVAFEIFLADELGDLPKSQHSEYTWMTREQTLRHPEVHPNTKAYLRKKGIH